METKYILRSHLKELMDGYMYGEGISANELAKQIGERRSTLNDLINNKDMESRRISARLFAKLCVFFRITPNELFSIVVIHKDDIEQGNPDGRKIQQVVESRRKKKVTDDQ